MGSELRVLWICIFIVIALVLICVWVFYRYGDYITHPFFDSSYTNSNDLFGAENFETTTQTTMNELD